MNKILTALALTLFAAGGAYAADKPMTQPEKMKLCSKAAVGKKGDERRQFMSACLKKGSDTGAMASAKPMSQQDKMKACNKEAADKKGDERKKFMSDCLKK